MKLYAKSNVGDIPRVKLHLTRCGDTPQTTAINQPINQSTEKEHHLRRCSVYVAMPSSLEASVM